MNSLSTSYHDLTLTLLGQSWFNVKAFPEATFDAKNFVRVGEKKYEAHGTLTIRDRAAPIIVTFTHEVNLQDVGRVRGYTRLKRTKFAVGQASWSSTKEVQDEVKVNFRLTAMKK